MNELPESWTTARLDELLAAIVGGGTPSKSKASYFQGTIPFMTVKDMHVRFIEDTQDHITQEALDDSASTLIPADTLVVATRMSLGKIARPKIPVAINQDLKALFLNDGIDKTYMEYAWRSKESQIQAMGTGTTVKGIRLEDIRGLELAVAPSTEQTRIADQLDAVLARLHTCNVHFDAIPALLKRFRQTVLEMSILKFVESHKTEIEESWVMKRIGDVASVGTGSTPLRSISKFYAASGTPWITSAATSDRFIHSANEYVTEEAIVAHRLTIYPIGTLLVAMYGEGKTRGQVSELAIEATINQACAAIVVDEKKVYRKYLKMMLDANYLAMRELAEGGNQSNLNLSKIREFELPIPTLKQQSEIVLRVEALFALAERIEARYAAARAHAQRLTPLLLAKAFRGELVPQDPNDEPASALLQRIAAQRTQAELLPKIRKPRMARAARAPKETAGMTKSRQDVDVKDQPYLADHLRRLGGANTAEALFKVAELPVADFYKQLAWEVAKGHIKDHKIALEAGHAP